MTKYPKVNYIGNKEKISDWIVSELPVKKGTVIDLFSGGSSVAYKLKQNGYRVITNDVLYSNYCIAKALIENNTVELDLTIDPEELSKYYSEETKESIAWLGNKIYFPEELNELASIINFSNTLHGEEKYIFLALLRRAMIRKIPYSRMNIKWEEIVKFRDEELSYQKYKRRRAYHNKSFLHHIYENLNSYNGAVFNNLHDNKAYQLDALEMLESLEERVDIVYIDPPYPSTMNNYQEFYGAYDKLFNKEIEYRDFTNKSTFLENLINLIKVAKNKSDYVIISLNNKSKPSYSDIQNAIESFVEKVVIKKRDHVYKVTGKENKQTNYEVLIIIKL